MAAKRIFTSYSRADSSVIKGLVALLRNVGSHVFLDTDSIPPGSKWEEEIHKAIEGCDQVMVFWCAHASKSDEVRKEYTHGLALKREICPVLLDGTDLAQSLKPYQWLDFRDVVGRHMEVERQTLSHDEVQRIQQADRQGPTPSAPGRKEAEDFDHKRAHYSDANLFRQGWRVDPDGGAFREFERLHEPSKEQLQTLANRVLAWLDKS